jgi:hypothetical protein
MQKHGRDCAAAKAESAYSRYLLRKYQLVLAKINKKNGKEL